MDLGPHVIPMKPGGVPVIIHASQYEGGDIDSVNHAGLDLHFLLLKADDVYHKFYPRSGATSDGMLPAELFYSRPDGKDGKFSLSLSRSNSVTNGEYLYPYDLYLLDFPAELTEVPGDVVCEIQVYSGSNEKNIVGRTANFIIRVEPYPKAQSIPVYGAGGAFDAYSGKDGSTPGIYYSGDPVDESLLTWAEVVDAANTGDLNEILEVGQQIQPVRLASGVLMGWRCIHIYDYNDAVFEAYHLIQAPEKWIYSASGAVRSGYVAASNYITGSRNTGYDHPFSELLPYEMYSAIYTEKPWSDAYFPVRIFGGDGYETVYENGLEVKRKVEQFEYYKKQENRIKTSTDGVARAWATNALDGDGWIVVSENGSEGRKPIDDSPCFVNPIIRIRGKAHEISPIDIQSWADVKAAAEKGKLKNSTLTVGQIMPELPTVGKLRCVHIEDTWAAFDYERLYLTTPFGSNGGGAMSVIQQANTDDQLSDSERDIFTVLYTVVSTKQRVYAQKLSAKNTGVGDNDMTGMNSILGEKEFDAFIGSPSARVKKDTSGNPVEWWSHRTGFVIQRNQTAYWFDESGDLQSELDNTAGSTVRYANGVFVVGEIS